MKTETIDFRSFVRNEWKKEDKTEKALRFLTSANGVLLVMIPKTALAATTDATFGNVYGAIMNLFDWGVVVVICFAGASWAFGHRTKALEILIGACAGYILARHAVDIRDFLKSI
jgi:hypothetical protein